MKINDGKSIKVPLNTFPCRGRGQVLAFLSLLFSPFSSPFTPLSFFFPFAALSLAGYLLVGSILGCSAFLSFIRDPPPPPPQPASFISRFPLGRRRRRPFPCHSLWRRRTRAGHTLSPPFVTRRHTLLPSSFGRFSRGNFPLVQVSLRRFRWRKLLTGTSARMINRRRVFERRWKTFIFVS